jgi:hypothetical protein
MSRVQVRMTMATCMASSSFVVNALILWQSTDLDYFVPHRQTSSLIWVRHRITPDIVHRKSNCEMQCSVALAILLEVFALLLLLQRRELRGVTPVLPDIPLLGVAMYHLSCFARKLNLVCIFRQASMVPYLTTIHPTSASFSLFSNALFPPFHFPPCSVTAAAVSGLKRPCSSIKRTSTVAQILRRHPTVVLPLQESRPLTNPLLALDVLIVIPGCGRG